METGRFWNLSMFPVFLSPASRLRSPLFPYPNSYNFIYSYSSFILSSIGRVKMNPVLLLIPGRSMKRPARSPINPGVIIRILARNIPASL